MEGPLPRFIHRLGVAGREFEWGVTPCRGERARARSHNPLETQLYKRVCKYMRKNLNHGNPVVKAVSNICLGNPWSVVGNNYKNAMAHVSPILNEHDNEKREVNFLKELINIRDGHVTCDILSKQEVSDIIVYLCTK